MTTVPVPDKLTADFMAALAELRAEMRRRNPRVSTRMYRVVPIDRMVARGYTLEQLREAHRQGTGYIVPGRDRQPAHFGVRS